jgi:hypothetical protein
MSGPCVRDIIACGSTFEQAWRFWVVGRQTGSNSVPSCLPAICDRKNGIRWGGHLTVVVRFCAISNRQRNTSLYQAPGFEFRAIDLVQ